MSEALARPKSAAPTHMDSHSLHIVVSRPTGKYRDGKRPYRQSVDEMSGSLSLEERGLFTDVEPDTILAGTALVLSRITTFKMCLNHG